MSDLFAISETNEKPKKRPAAEYTADDIEVLEGLEPVRRRPGMYIGGTDENALHHMAAEVLDNAMDEAVAGYASLIKFILNEDGSVRIEDNGRGIPPDFWVASSSAADAAQTHIAFVQMGVGNPIDEWGKGISDYLPYDLMEKFSTLKKSPDNFTSKYCDTLLNELSLLNMTRRRGLFGGLLSKIF